MKITSLKNLPNFSDRNYILASYICGALVTASSIFFIYEMFSTGNFKIEIQWNIFKSAWFTPLFIMGFILAIVNWGKFGHWGGQPVNIYEDQHGNKYRERNNDIIDNMFGHIILPLLGHFVIEPIIYACIIFYPLMCIFALLGIILPYVITLILLAILGLIFESRKFTGNAAYRSVILIMLTFLMGGGLTWVSWSLEKSKNPTVSVAMEKSASHTDETTPEDDMFTTTDNNRTENTGQSSDTDTDAMFNGNSNNQTNTSNASDPEMFQ